MQAVKETCVGPNSDRITVLPVDVTGSEEQLQRFAHTADALHGGLDYAFLAAGGPAFITRVNTPPTCFSCRGQDLPTFINTTFWMLHHA
jgi:NAD(P)-dependent dehydrogenase (short-subunit alcohol dehydrogenase family)